MRRINCCRGLRFHCRWEVLPLRSRLSAGTYKQSRQSGRPCDSAEAKPRARRRVCLLRPPQSIQLHRPTSRQSFKATTINRKTSCAPWIYIFTAFSTLFEIPKDGNQKIRQFVAIGAVSTPTSPPQLPPLQTYYTMATSYKPSPLSYGSPRASPFRRPESPMSPSPLRQTTPTPSPSKTAPAATTPSRLANASTPTEDTGTWTPRGLTPVTRQREPSPTRGANTSASYGDMLPTSRRTGDSNALSKLQPAQVRELREGFQILDRDSDGQVGREQGPLCRKNSSR